MICSPSSLTALTVLFVNSFSGIKRSAREAKGNKKFNKEYRENSERGQAFNRLCGLEARTQSQTPKTARICKQTLT